jgi:multisubunit Na+/H+ antiporter MnhE subunit
MKRFIIADGVIQGILAIASVACFAFFYSFRTHIKAPFFYFVYALIGWQLLSSLTHVLKKNSLPKNRYLYGLQLIQLGYTGCIALVLISSSYTIIPNSLAKIFDYLFYGGIFTLVPALLASIAFLTVRRLFIPMPSAA